MAPSHHRARRDRLRALLGTQVEADWLIVTGLPNIRYLSGFSGSNAVLVVGRRPADDVIGTDGRYRDQVAHEAPGLPTIIDRDTLAVTAAALPAGPVAVESSVSIGDVQALTASRGMPLVSTGLVEQLRAVKDDIELEALGRACAITVSALDVLAREMAPGASELALARRLEQLFGEFGAEDRAFDTIVGSGPHSAIPHHQPGPRLLERGDLVVVDAGARVDGYHADMTRTFLVAADPEQWQAAIHDLVQRGQAAATAQYLPGSNARAVDSAARDVITAGGHGDDFTHGLGHGVGLQIHEAPLMGPRATGTLEAAMAITVEPGIYLPGRGGVRIEDTLVVTGTGPRILTEASRDLVVVG